MDPNFSIIEKTPGKEFLTLNSGGSSRSKLPESNNFRKNPLDQNGEYYLSRPNLSGQNEEVKSYSEIKNLNEGITTDDTRKTNQASIRSAENVELIPGHLRSSSKSSS